MPCRRCCVSALLGCVSKLNAAAADRLTSPYRATIVAVMEYDAERPWIRFPAIGGTSASPGRQRSLFELGSGALEDDQAADSLRFLPEDWAADLYLSARPCVSAFVGPPDLAGLGHQS